MSKTDRIDPLAGLIAQEISPAQKADRWAGRLLKLTLLLVFAGIALFILVLLVNVGVLSESLLAPVLPYWSWLAGATLATVLATLITGLLKMSYEMTEQ
ncbi:hypothetical protein QWZ03_06940 [Chitinimonas viridis]|uniref:Holin-X, holin superfamily III n=1 Tax=Chitinimonas viridis TaxID=664880 RepID=A0ABT8B3B2_9NEIS|nr:hypothetical protein [Chitinimonas viridis]MDN3576499.1 hypothetical protein [Chitinimonas viridis]